MNIKWLQIILLAYKILKVEYLSTVMKTKEIWPLSQKILKYNIAYILYCTITFYTK